MGGWACDKGSDGGRQEDGAFDGSREGLWESWWVVEEDMYGMEGRVWEGRKI